MGAEIDLDIAFNFVSKEPDPGVPEVINAANTFDATGHLIVLLLCALACFVIGFVIYKFLIKRPIISSAQISGNHVASSSRHKASNNFFRTFIVAVLGVVLAFGALYGLTSSIKALAANEDKPGPDVITVCVDEANNTISIEDGWFKNIETQDMLLANSSLTIDEQCADIEELVDCKFKIDGFGGTVFYDHPNVVNYIPTDTGILQPGETTTLKFNFEDLSVETCKKLFGKTVFHLELVSKDLYADEPIASDLTYNGEEQIGVEELEGFTLEGDISAKNAGDYSATAKLRHNYKWKDGSTDDKVVNWKIDKANAAISTDDKSKTYGQADPKFTAQISGMVAEETLTEGTDYTLDRDEGTDVGSYSINANVISTEITDNYEFNILKGNLTISELVVTLSWDVQPLTYNGKIQYPIASVSNKISGDDVVVATYEPLENYDAKSAGEQKAKAKELSGEDAKNYTLDGSVNSVEYSIAVLLANLTWDVQTYTYNGSVQYPVATITNIVQGDDVSVSDYAPLEGYDSKSAGTQKAKAVALAGESASNYAINEATNSVQYSIGTATLTVTTESKEKVYDGSPLKAAATITGLQQDEVLIVINTGGQTDVGTSTNTYVVKWDDPATTAKQSNYSFSQKDPGTLTVTKRTVRISSLGASKTYDGSSLSKEEIKIDDTVEGEGFVSGEGGTATNFASLSNVGETDNTFNFVFNNNTNESNYDVKYTYGKLKITNAQITVSAPDQVYVYNGSPQGLAISASTIGNAPTTITYSFDGQTYTSEVPKITNVADSDDEIFYKVEAPNHEPATGTYGIKINPYDIATDEDSYISHGLSGEIIKYDGQPHKPTVYLKFKETDLAKDTDFALICEEKTNATDTANYIYQIQGKGNFTGDIYDNWQIVSKIFSNDIEISQTKDLIYNFNNIDVVSSNALKVSDKTIGKDLKLNEDYKVVSGSTAKNVSDNIEIIIEGIGNYQSSVTGSWKILPKSINDNNLQVNDSDEPITLVYDSGPHNVDITKVALKSPITEAKTVIDPSNYDVQCESKTNAGEYTYKIVGKGNFCDTKEMTWVLSPKQIDFIEIYGNREVFTSDGAEHTVTGYLAKAYEKKEDGTLNEIKYFKNDDDNLSPHKAEITKSRTEVGKDIITLPSFGQWKCDNTNFKLPEKETQFYLNNGYIAINPENLLSAEFSGTPEGETIIGNKIDYSLKVTNMATEGKLTNAKATFAIWIDNTEEQLVRDIGDLDIGQSTTVTAQDVIKDLDFDSSASPTKIMRVSIDYTYDENELTSDFSTSNTLVRTKVTKPVAKNFEYSKTEVGYPDTDDYTVTNDAKRTDVGTYTATVTLNKNYLCWSDDSSITPYVFSWQITKKMVTVKAKDAEITYGGAASNNGCEYSGYVVGDTIVDTWTPNYAYKDSSDKAYVQYESGIGTYKIIPSGLSNANYDFSYVNGTLTVSAKEISLKWAPSKIQYTGSGLAPTATVEGDFNGYKTQVTAYSYAEKGTEVWTTDKPKDLGNYTAKATAIDSTNYVLPENVTFDFEIFEGRRVYAKIENKTVETATFQTLTIKYDDQFSVNDVMVSDEPSGNSSLFAAYSSSVKEVIFDSSLSIYKNIKSTKNWFNNFTKLDTVTGFGNFNTTNLVSIEGMFSGATSLTQIDVSDFKTTTSTNCTNVFAGDTSLETIIVGANWNSNLGTCALEGDNWFDANANCLKPANLPVGISATYTKAKYSITFNMNKEGVGQISGTPDVVYFNDIHEAKIAIDASDSSKITITVLRSEGGTSDQTYTKTASATNFDWRFKEWSFTPELTDGECSGNTTATANFELKEFPKALFTNNNKLVFRYDNTDYTGSTDYKNVFAIKNTNYTGTDSYVLPEWIDSSSKSFKVSPTEVVFESSFADFEKYRVEGREVDFTSVSAWFMNLPDTCTSISGLENINTLVNNYSYLFNNALGIESLDLTGLSIDGTKIVTSMFSNCKAFKEIKFGTNWKVNFSNCSLPGNAWLNSKGEAFVPSAITVPPASEITYTLGDKEILFKSPAEEYGKIDSYETIYFNDNYQTSYSLSGQDNMKLTVTVGETSYVRNAIIVGDDVLFNEWTIDPVTTSVITAAKSTFTANFKLDKVAKAVLYKDGLFKFFYDDVDHSKDANFDKQFHAINTDYDAGTFPEWFTEEGQTSIQPTSIEFDGSFSLSEITSTSAWFKGFTSAESITYMKNLPSTVKNTSYMFSNFTKSSAIAFSGDNALVCSEISNAKCMFENCSEMSKIDLSSFNVKSDAVITNIFSNCTKLKEFTFDDSWKCGFNNTGFSKYWISANGDYYIYNEIPSSASSITYTYADKCISFYVDPAGKGKITNGESSDLATDPIYFNNNHKVKVVESGTSNSKLKINIYKKGSDSEVGKTINKEASSNDIAYLFDKWSYDPAIASGEIQETTAITAKLKLDNYGKAIYDEATTTLTFKFDNVPVNGEYKLFNTSYSENSNENKLPAWFDGTTPKIQPTKIVFNESFAQFKQYVQDFSKIDFNSMAGWFMNFTDVISVTGLNYINNCVKNTDYTFYGFSKNTCDIDFGGLNLTSLNSAKCMFKNCQAFTHANLTNLKAEGESNFAGMFSGCNRINKITIGSNWNVALDKCGIDESKMWLDDELSAFATKDLGLKPASAKTYELATKEISLTASGAEAHFINDSNNKDIEKVYYNNNWTASISTGYDEDVNSETWAVNSFKDYVQVSLSPVTTSNDNDVINIKCPVVLDDDSDVLSYELSDWTISQAKDSVRANFVERNQPKAVTYTDGRMVFYYDNLDHSSDENYDNSYTVKNTNAEAGLIPTWESKSGKPNIHPSKVVFDSSFAKFKTYISNKTLFAFRSISGWFMGFDSVQTFEGLNNVPATIENATYAFKSYSATGTLDLSSLNLPNLKRTAYMFADLPYTLTKVVAPNIDLAGSTERTIDCSFMFANSKWLREAIWHSSAPINTRARVSSSVEMFIECNMLNTVDCSAIYFNSNSEVTDTLTNCYTLAKIMFNSEQALSTFGLYNGYNHWDWWYVNELAPAWIATEPWTERDTWFYKYEIVNVNVSNAYRRLGDSATGGSYFEDGKYEVDFCVYEESGLRYEQHDGAKFIVTYGGNNLFAIPVIENFPYRFDCFDDERTEIPIWEATNVHAYFHSDQYENNTSKWVYDSSSKTLSLYYDSAEHAGAQDFAVNTTSPDDVPWKNYKSDMENIVIDESFEQCVELVAKNNPQTIPLTSVAYWFCDIFPKNPCHITGLEHIKADITDTSYMFNNATIEFENGCLDLTGMNLSHVENAQYMLSFGANAISQIESIVFPDNAFSQGNLLCQANSILGEPERHMALVKVKSIYLGENFGRNIADFSLMFVYIENLTSINVNNINFENAENLNYFLGQCFNLEYVDLSNNNMDNITTMSNLFSYCNKLKAVNFGVNTFPSLTSISEIFKSCSCLETVDLSKLCCERLNCSSAFMGCNSLTKVDINTNEFNGITKISNCKSMFSGDKNLKEVNWSNCRNSCLMKSYWQNAFLQCYNITGPLYIPENLDVKRAYEITPQYIGLNPGVGNYATLEFNEIDIGPEDDLFAGGNIYFRNYTNINFNKVGDNYNNATLKVLRSAGSAEYDANSLTLFYKNGSTVYPGSTADSLIVNSPDGVIDDIVLQIDKRIESLEYEWKINGSQIPVGGFVLEGQDVVELVVDIKNSSEIPKVGKAILSDDMTELKFVYDDLIYDPSIYKHVFIIKNGRNEWVGTGIKKIVIDESFKNFDKVEDGTQFYSTSHWFEGFKEVESFVGLENMPDCITDASYMFAYFVPTTECLDLSTLHLDNLDNAMGMFSYFGQTKPKIKQATYTLKLADNFASTQNCAVSNIKDEQSSMFFYSYIQNIEFGKNSFEETKNFTMMFYQCRVLNTIDLSNFSTASKGPDDLIDISGMFYYCPYLYKVDFWHQNTYISNVGIEGHCGLFWNSYSISIINMSSLNFSQTKFFKQCMFSEQWYNITRFSEIIVGGWDGQTTLGYVGAFGELDAAFCWHEDGNPIATTTDNLIPANGKVYNRNLINVVTINADYNNYFRIFAMKYIPEYRDLEDLNFKTLSLPFLKAAEDQQYEMYGWFGTIMIDYYGAGNMNIIDGFQSLDESFTVYQSPLSGDTVSEYCFARGIEDRFMSIFDCDVTKVVEDSGELVVKYNNISDIKTGKVVSYDTGQSLKTVFYYDNKDHSKDAGAVKQFDIINTNVASPEKQPWVKTKEFCESSKIVIDKSFANCTTLTDEYGVEKPFYSTAGWFVGANTTNIEGFEYINGQLLTDTNCMFQHSCADVKDATLDITKLDTSNVTNMSFMFCESGYSFINTATNFGKSATSIECLYAGCGRLRELDLRSFNTMNFADERSYKSAFEKVCPDQISFGLNWMLPITAMSTLDEFKWADADGNLWKGIPERNTTYYILE